MIVLHTSDWHLGRTLFGKKRDAEFEAFLDWLLRALDEHHVDALLIAGDVFDTSVPSHRAQALYYRFLRRVAATHCRHVVVVAGNHDSPSFLDAPQELLKALDVHVIGEARSDPADEVIVLRQPDGQPEALICAVPYLRDRDLRSVEADESVQDKEAKLLHGLRQHYAAVGAHAEALRAEFNCPLPIIGMGHLFAAGAVTVDGDGVRDLYVGSLGHVSAAHFPACFDYLALGHLHVAQQVAGQDHLRYSGSPLAMGFGEARQQKVMLLVAFDAQRPQIRPIEVPVFQSLQRVQGDWSHIETQLRQLKASGQSLWLEVIYNGDALLGDLRERVEEAVAGSALEVLRIRNLRLSAQLLSACQVDESLADLDPQQVFNRCLDAHAIPEAQRVTLLASYQDVLRSIDEADPQAG